MKLKMCIKTFGIKKEIFDNSDYPKDSQYFDKTNKKVIGKFNDGFLIITLALPFWFRYVDDTFTLFDSKNTATQFLHYLNNCHANIKFTVEFEENSTLPFPRHSHQTQHSCFLNIYLPKEDLHRPVHKMGLLHT